MAIQTTRINIQHIFMDSDGKTSECMIPLPTTTTLPNARAYANAQAPLVAALSNAAYIGYNLNLTIEDDAIVGEPAAASEVEKKGKFTYKSEYVGKFVTFSLPGINPSILLPDGENIDQEQATVIEFNRAVIDGVEDDGAAGTQAIVAGIGGCTDSRGSGLLTWNAGEHRAKEAYAQHRKSVTGARKAKG